MLHADEACQGEFQKSPAFCSLYFTTCETGATVVKLPTGVFFYITVVKRVCVFSFSNYSVL